MTNLKIDEPVILPCNETGVVRALANLDGKQLAWVQIHGSNRTRDWWTYLAKSLRKIEEFPLPTFSKKKRGTAFREGVAAFEDDQPSARVCNPYPKGSRERHQFANGFWAAKKRERVA
jgi:hypothetical protein